MNKFFMLKILDSWNSNKIIRKGNKVWIDTLLETIYNYDRYRRWMFIKQDK